MEWIKGEGIILEYSEGWLVGVGGRYLINKVGGDGTSNAVEQQLQTQKGVQVSSPQPLECWS